MQVRQHVIIALLGLLLAGCGAAATPVAVFEEAVIPTRQPTPTPVPMPVAADVGVVFPAAQGGTLTLGSDVNGFIDGDNYAQVYTFEGLAGQRIDVSMSGAGDLDTYLIMIGPDGREITRNDDRSQRSTDAELRDVNLEDNGTYTIVATVWRQRYTLQAGNYRLQLREAQPSGAPPSPRTTFISYGVTQYETITNESYWDAFTFRGEAGDVVDISMFAEDGIDPDGSLALTDSYGNELAHNDDLNPLNTLDALIFDFVLPYTGYYTVVASRYGGKFGVSTGNYELTVDRVDQIAVDRLAFGYRDANQSVSLLDAPDTALNDAGYFVGDTFEIDLNGVELLDVPIQAVLTFYLPPITGEVAGATLDLTDCDTNGSAFAAIAAIDVFADEIDERITADTSYAPSAQAERLGTLTDCDMVDVTDLVVESYAAGMGRLQFRLIPQATVANNTDDLVVFLAPRLMIELEP